MDLIDKINPSNLNVWTECGGKKIYLCDDLFYRLLLKFYDRKPMIYVKGQDLFTVITIALRHAIGKISV